MTDPAEPNVPPATAPPAAPRRTWWDRLRRPDEATLVFVGLFLFYVFRYVTFTGARLGGDGYYSWIFARSIALDGDIHFANDYALCGDPWHVGADEGGHRPANPFYVGMALIWSPVLRVLSWIIPIPAGSPASWRNGCDGPWVVGTLATAPLFAVLTLYLGYRVARRWASERVALASVLVVGLCTPLTHFGTLIPSYSHTWAAFGVAVAFITWVRAEERPESIRRWAIAGAAIGFAGVMRNQSLAMLLSPALMLFDRLVRDVREKRVPRGPILAGLVTLGACLAVFMIQLGTYKTLYGNWWVVPQGKSYLHLAHGQPIMQLFAARSGFFYWHPLHWIGAIGLGMLIASRPRRLFGIALTLPILIDVYINSSAYWHGGASFGARRLTTVAAPFVATGAVALAVWWRWIRATPRRTAVFAATGWLLPWTLINVGASTANVDGRVSFDHAVPMPELYGNGLRYGLDGIYQAAGNPFIWPVSLPFAIRYGMHPRKFDLLATGGMFEHGYRPVHLQGPDTIVFSDAALDPLVVRGLTRTPEGMLVRAGTEGRILVELSWGYVTHAEIDARAVAGNARLTIVNRHFVTGHDVGEVTVSPQGGSQSLALANRTFVTGINELVFRADRDVVLRRFRFVDRGVHDSSIH